MKPHAFSLFILLAFTLSNASASDSPALQRWERVVCIQSPEKDKPNSAKLCTAYLVHTSDKLFLVTSGHGSEETSAKSRLVYRDPSGKSQWVSLKKLFSGESNPWHRDPTSDFAIAHLQPDDDGQRYLEHLKALSVPLDSVSTEPQSPTTPIVTGGFPLGLGAKEPIAPLAVVGYIASEEIKSDTRWGHAPIIYCSPAVAQGTSGGPAFLMDESPDSATVVGMYVGVVSDVSGAKLSKMVPSRFIHAAIVDFTPATNRE